ncbi:type VI secretion system tube protein TssD [Capnocytophaga cynodegmi]|uniref:type VI secretion system tube protein TssD n=1 Tax=Capnocytophaga cynodegmi TaxID=28189 RepID=UPI00385EC83A
MNLSNITNNVIGLFQPDANLEVFLILKEREYQLKQFDMSFFQLTDIKGEPQAEVNGGKFTIAIAELPDEQLLYWVTNQWIKRDGEIVFRNKTTSAPLKISFKNAYCVDMLQRTNASQGVVSSFVISAESLVLNTITFDNQWTE